MDYVHTVLNRISTELADIPDHFPFVPQGLPAFTPAVQRAFKRIQEHFIITYCDKAANNLVVICRPLAARVLLADMQAGADVGDPVYEHVQQSPEAVMRALDVQLDALQIRPGASALPPYTLIPKPHKDHLAWRYLALSNAAYLQPANVWMQRIFKALAPELKVIWDTLNFPTGHQFNGPAMWIINNSASTLKLVHKVNASMSPSQQHTRPAWFRTFDCERLFTAPPHADLEACVSQFLTDVFARHQDTPVLAVNRLGTAQWMPGPLPVRRMKCRDGFQWYHVDLQSALQLLHLVLHHAYVVVGDRVFRQRRGIPMGANPSPSIINIYLFTYEFEFMHRTLEVFLVMDVHRLRGTLPGMSSVLSCGVSATWMTFSLLSLVGWGITSISFFTLMTSSQRFQASVAFTPGI